MPKFRVGDRVLFGATGARKKGVVYAVCDYPEKNPYVYVRFDDGSKWISRPERLAPAESETKFKVGDRVYHTACKLYGVVTLENNGMKDCCNVKYDGEETPISALVEYLVPVIKGKPRFEFSIGDRVKVTLPGTGTEPFLATVTSRAAIAEAAFVKFDRTVAIYGWDGTVEQIVYNEYMEPAPNAPPIPNEQRITISDEQIDRALRLAREIATAGSQEQIQAAPLPKKIRHFKFD